MARTRTGGEPCGFCDNCEGGVEERDTSEPFPARTRVIHSERGKGVVEESEGG